MNETKKGNRNDEENALPSAIMAESCGDDVERMPIIVIYEFEQ